MRISDWSSDVCSSDLIGFLFSHHARHQVLHAAPIAFELSRRYPKILDQNHRLRQTRSLRPAEALGALSERTLRTRACSYDSMRCHGRPARQEIGRAPCRERVGQEV